jgi:catechol 2,3-dioxygenase-like lactoylglutathione lyase family enzyme
MNSTDSILGTYPIVIIPRERLAATRHFYQHQLGMTLVFASTWFVALSLGGEGAPTLALMAHDHPSSPPGPETFDGKGVLLTIQVDDARRFHDRVRGEGVEIVYPLRDEPWGQRRFMIRDPAGSSIDVVEQTEPQPGYWDPYFPEIG